MKYISKQAYKKGVVIVKCDDCKNNHLIADNLNWFTDMGDNNNVEDILRAKGQSVLKISSEELEFLLQDTVKQITEAKDADKKLLVEKAEEKKQSEWLIHLQLIEWDISPQLIDIRLMTPPKTLDLNINL